MVKADVKHNYYADLELPTNCSLDDIKKQYRKLALLYHPDRNAGKEEEYVPRFQAIQTAHEILGDAGQKARYDADRRKAGLSATGGVGGGGGGSYNSRPSPAQPTGNPYKATSAYPPPPRRTQPGTWQRPQGFGAERNNFPRSTPTARKDPAQDRTNMFKAWQNMNNPQDRQQQRTTPGSASSTTAQTGASTPTPNRPRPPPPPRPDPKMPSEEEIRAGMNYRKPPPQFDGDRVDRGQSAWASFQQKNQGKPGVSRSSTTKTPRKQGFDPSAPGSDERPAGGNSGYAQRHRSEDYGRPQPGQTFPPPPPGPPPQSPPSTRTSPTAQRPFADPLRPFKSRTSDDGAPYSEANRRRTPYSSFSGEKFHFQREENDNLRRSASTRDTSKLDPNSTHASRARSTSPLGRQAKDNSQAQGGPQKPFVDYSDSDDSDERRSPDDLESTSPNGNRRPGTVPHSQTPFERPKKVPTPPSQRFGGSSQPFSPPPPSSDANQAEPMQQKTSNNIFSFPISPDMFTPNGKSKSTENINTQFSPEGWNGEFKGSPDYFSSSAQPSARKASSPFRRDKANLRSSAARNASASTSRHGSVSDMPPPPPPSQPKAPSSLDEEPQQQRQSQGTPSAGPTFSKEEWEKHFQEPSWAWPPPPQPPSPSKVSAAKSRGSKKASRAAKAGNNGQSQGFGDSTDASVGPEVAEDDAMDIDTPPTSKPAQASQAETDPSKEPRLYSVPPSQWRQQQHAQVNGHGRPSSSRGVSGEEADLKTNLDDLANVEPMTKGPEGGLKNLSDLSSTLPFQSQPSGAPPRQSFEPQKLTIPPIPKAPEQPSKLTRQTWQTFAQSFGDYLQAYHHFNSIMLQHFTSRESHDQSRFAEGTAWLEAVGDPAGMTPNGPIGFGSYLQGVREDERVREAWNLGCERHTEACKEFEKVRERVKRLVGNGALVDH